MSRVDQRVRIKLSLLKALADIATSHNYSVANEALEILKKYDQVGPAEDSLIIGLDCANSFRAWKVESIYEPVTQTGDQTFCSIIKRRINISHRHLNQLAEHLGCSEFYLNSILEGSVPLTGALKFDELDKFFGNHPGYFAEVYGNCKLKDIPV